MCYVSEPGHITIWIKKANPSMSVQLFIVQLFMRTHISHLVSQLFIRHCEKPEVYA